MTFFHGTREEKASKVQKTTTTCMVYDSEEILDSLRKFGERDVLLRNWRPGLDDEHEMPSTKRARMTATSELYEELCREVSSAIRAREQRDHQEREKSREIAERFPLVQITPPADMETPPHLSSNSTPTMESMRENLVLCNLPALKLDSQHDETPMKVKARHATSLFCLKKVGCQKNVDEMEIPFLSIY